MDQGLEHSCAISFNCTESQLYNTSYRVQHPIELSLPALHYIKVLIGCDQDPISGCQY